MRRVSLCIVAIILSVMLTTAGAEKSLFDIDQVLGVAMPSPDVVIGREASTHSDTDGGSQDTYLNFSEADYRLWAILGRNQGKSEEVRD